MLTVHSRFVHTGDCKDSLEHEEKRDDNKVRIIEYAQRNFEKNVRNIRLIPKGLSVKQII